MYSCPASAGAAAVERWRKLCADTLAFRASFPRVRCEDVGSSAGSLLFIAVPARPRRPQARKFKLEPRGSPTSLTFGIGLCTDAQRLSDVFILVCR